MWGSQSVGVVVCKVTFWVSYGAKLNFHSKPEIFYFHFLVFSNLTLEFCYDQINDPGTLQIVLKDAYLC